MINTNADATHVVTCCRKHLLNFVAAERKVSVLINGNMKGDGRHWVGVVQGVWTELQWCWEDREPQMAVCWTHKDIVNYLERESLWERERDSVCVCVCMCACMCVCVFINHTPVDLLLHSESILRTWMVQIIHFWTISSAVQFYYNYIINYTLISARWCHSIWHHQVVVVILSNPQVILDLTIKKLCSRLKLL